MIESVIDLSPKMQNRLDFRHDLFDGLKDNRRSDEERYALVVSYVTDGGEYTRNELITEFLWLAKDVVCRYRAHFPQIRHLTDDMCSVALLALTEFVDELTEADEFFNRMQRKIAIRVRDFINDNRSTFSASRATNERRQKSEQPLEYNCAIEHNDEMVGGSDFDPHFVDVLDELEQLSDVDTEEFRDLVAHFLQHDHDINEKELTNAEREALDKLVRIYNGG